jgi:uncharacterized membrane protein
MFVKKVLSILEEFQLPGYSLPETIFYSTILIFSLYVIFKITKKLKISFDSKIAIAIAPYIALGSLLRVSRDLGFLPFQIFTTPWIYFLVFFLITISLALSFLIQMKFKIWLYKSLFLIGLVLLIFPLTFLISVGLINVKGVELILIFFFPWIILFRFVKWKIENKAVALIQVFDGTVTSIAINFFGYGEQHWLPNIIISTFGPFSFVFVKFFVVIIILIFLDKFCKKKELRNYIKLMIGILGSATGLRDFICLATFCSPY